MANKEHTTGHLPPLLEMDVRQIRDLGREIHVPLYVLASISDVQVLDPREVGTYKKNLLHRNTELRWAAQSAAFSPIFYPFYESVDVLLTGSHARLENRFFLPPDQPAWDIILMGKDDGKLEECREILLAKAEQGILPPISSDVEVVNVGRQKPLSSYGDTRSNWPDRIMYGHLLSGSRQQFLAADERVSQEWHESIAIRKNVLGNFNKFVHSLESGLYEHRQQFDPETGDIHYSPEQKVFGLKFGPLRALQLFFAIHDLSQRLTSFRRTYETNMQKRLDYFFPDDAGAVKFAYDQALCVHHWQQFQASLGKDATLSLGAEQLADITMPILNFIKAHPLE